MFALFTLVGLAIVALALPDKIRVMKMTKSFRNVIRFGCVLAALTVVEIGSAADKADPEVAMLWFDRCSQPDLGSQAACTSFIFGVNELHKLLRLHKKVELYRRCNCG